MRLKNKTVVITGGGSGIGRATALLFADEGADITVADINVKLGQRTVSMIQEQRKNAIFVEVDVSKAEDIREMVRKTIKVYGKIDVLHNNAGVSRNTLGIKERDTVITISERNWDRIMNVNLKGAYLCSKYAIPEMIKNAGGSIINMASECGLVGCPGAAYSASKGGIVLLTKHMALEYARQNIRVNCICPCNVRTPMTEKDLLGLGQKVDEIEQAITKSMPMGRLAEPEEIAYAALYLASDESSFTTGTILTVDGGVTAGGTHTYWCKDS